MLRASGEAGNSGVGEEIRMISMRSNSLNANREIILKISPPYLRDIRRKRRLKTTKDLRYLQTATNSSLGDAVTSQTEETPVKCVRINQKPFNHNI